ncbi:hypothetical protein CYV26_00815 [Carnobacterium maltaromaticum]|uniref:hypothetical protein n=1 Tax=Carnobacterium maltaromaticum TaxID=2751 RepID=UPI000C77F557|nr:hypothetical protein [Carnobacterium maltaromaticum]PLS37029.1 hypothetical protein CYV33_05695 [Carnobacterium maltaromaticum]PLS37843.1 hypothetical protein CYV30_05690 [Carnobacterium maltaromaticum]PLS39784.1 hypothetical protein CYV31_03675 [Carnobacterium maltaromaticum]PLS44540.1 hypothetical protein CYV28_05690 [Carnobacterium maltaromaticum]PLS46573.1 hypothetical protein CYV27_05685 [Carnobacterium maltaromaticum]
MRKLIISLLVLTIGIVSLNVNSVEGLAMTTEKSSKVKKNSFKERQQDAIQMNTFLENKKIISLEEFNRNIFSIVTMTTEDQLQEFSDYVYYLIMTHPW